MSLRVCLVVGRWGEGWFLRCRFSSLSVLVGLRCWVGLGWSVHVIVSPLFLILVSSVAESVRCGVSESILESMLLLGILDLG